MRDKETSDRIKARITEALTAFGEKAGPKCSPDLLRRIRRAELLKRNDKFLLELEEIFRSWEGELKERDEQIAEAERLSPAEREEELMPSPAFLKGTISGTNREYKRALEDLCFRWGISDRWGGKLEDLDRYAIGGAQIFFREWTGKTGSIPFGGMSLKRDGLTYQKQVRHEYWQDAVSLEASYIYLKISPETQRGDVLKAWRCIDLLQKRIYGFSGRAQKTFNRDLCFRDLLHKPDEYGFGKLSAGDVMNLWNPLAPLNLRVKSADAVKKDAKAAQGYIDRITVLGYEPIDR